MRRRLVVRIAVLFPLFLLTSCPAPIMIDLVDSVRDLSPPVIAVISPGEYAPYSRVLAIEGLVSDLSSPGQPGKVSSLSYEILSHAAPKDVAIGSDGSFSIAEPNDLRENIVVLLKATDWNGNVSEYRLPLTFPGNEIPSFASLEGNRQTTLSWDAVPGVITYTLYIEPSAKTPDPANSTAISGVTSPFTRDSLKNGSLYSFLLEGNTSDGRKNYSAVVRSIPLSTMHLFPSAASYFNGIEFSWRTIPTVQLYEVLRATTPAGPWISISGPVALPPFFDSSVDPGTTYYYSVRPASYSSVSSEWVEAQADPVASRSDAAVAAYSGIESAQSSVWRDGYLYVADYYYGLRILNVSNPSIPIAAGKVEVISAKGLALSGDYAYVSGQKYMLGIHLTQVGTICSSIVWNSRPICLSRTIQGPLRNWSPGFLTKRLAVRIFGNSAGLMVSNVLVAKVSVYGQPVEATCSSVATVITRSR